MRDVGLSARTAVSSGDGLYAGLRFQIAVWDGHVSQRTSSSLYISSFACYVRAASPLTSTAPPNEGTWQGYVSIFIPP